MARTPESHTLNFASNSNQVEDASQTQISNQYAAKGGSQTEITQEFAGDYISQTEISIQTAAEEVTGTDIRHMDASFYKAAAEGNMNILRNMSLGYMLDKLTPKRNTILHIAVQFGQLHCVNWILQFRSLSSLLLQPNLKGDTPLHLAAREGHWVVTQVLIKAAKELPSGRGIGGDKMMLRMTNNENDTALHEAVRYNHPAVVKLLILEDPYFIYGANSSGGTPLYMAAERGFHELVQIIIDNTRNLPAHSGLTGRTALHAAVICNDEDMTKKILGWKNGLTKEVDDNGWSPLHCAAYLGYTSIARQLLEKSDKCVVYLRVKNDHKKTALHIAASCGHTEIVKLLVSQYPDCCEQVDDNGNNALHLIMIKMGISGDSGLLNFPWMSFRGLMNEKNDEGKTPLHLLADHQMFHCGHFIMHKMVDKMVLDNENSTPMDIMLSAEDKHGEKVKTNNCMDAKSSNSKKTEKCQS
ncbi:ankyrin repeat-containing protein NPR4-like isoform X2 [Vitis riparia]|uniref:ankyrin repeat-containing protein NPR4-like isoform X2 n=1 Tax=Vitis riparia TaxID=96939 RepID=UPI00155A0A10|nr:ankyrin repeat-containing protein NPR4-like isoform X2 [Vitis riparia]